MKRNLGRLVALMGIALIVSCLVVCSDIAASPKDPAKPIYFILGSSSSASVYYVMGQNLTDIINKYCKPAIATHISTGASVDNMRRIGRKEIQIGSVVGMPELFKGYNGMPPDYEGKPVTMARSLFAYTDAPRPMKVRADLPIRCYKDLEGRKVYLGIAGSSTFRNQELAMRALGVKVKVYTGSTRDAVTAFKERRIDAFLVAPPTRTEMDATTVEAMIYVPIRLVGWSKEEVEKIHALDPLLVIRELKPGSYKEFPGQPEPPHNWTWSASSLAVMTSEAPQEIAYSIIKAVYDHRDYMKAGGSPFKSLSDPKGSLAFIIEEFQLLRKLAPEKKTPPLHAGAVQYYKSIGMTVPDWLIPPEYVAK